MTHAHDFQCASESSAIAISRLKALRKTLGNDDQQLQKYLNWSGLPCLEELPLGEPRSTARSISRQPWVTHLEQLLNQLDQARRDRHDTNHRQTTAERNAHAKTWDTTHLIDNEIALSDIHRGAGVHRYACIVAIQALKEECSNKELETLSPEAWRDVTRHLWAMQHQSCEALFRRTQSLHTNLARGSNLQEHAFADWLIDDGGYKTLLREHSALARLIAQGIEFWVRDTSLLIQRFNADKKELAKLSRSQAINTITKIDDGLSDPHGGKQFVKRVWLNNGTGLVYKPRNCSSLQILSEVIQTLKQKHPEINLRTPRCLE